MLVFYCGMSLDENLGSGSSPIRNPHVLSIFCIDKGHVAIK